MILKLILLLNTFRYTNKNIINSMTTLPTFINSENIKNFTKAAACYIRNDNKTNQL